MVRCVGRRATGARSRWFTFILVCIPLSMIAARGGAQEGAAPVAIAPVVTSVEVPKEPVLSGPRSDWSLRITPYFWLASVGMNTGRTASVDLDVGELAQLLRGAFMINTEAQYRDLGIVVDYIWVKLQKSRDLGQSGDGSAKFDATQSILDVRAFYRLYDSRQGGKKGAPGTQLMLDMGARYFNLESSLSVNIPALLPNGQGVDQKLDGDYQWWDWVVGGHVRTDVTSRVGLGLSANIGGFNIGNSSKYSWEVTTGVLFRLWKCLQLDVGYRGLQVVRDGSDLRGELKTRRVTMSGLILGLSAAF